MVGYGQGRDFGLTVIDGPARGTTYSIPPGRSEIGRLAGVAFPIADRSVSRRHAMIERTAGGVSIRDLGSANGTYVNRVQLRGVTALRDGDEVRVGAVVLRFGVVVRDETAGVPPLPYGASGWPTQPSSFGDVHGPVQTGPGEQYVAGRDQYVSGGDQFVDHSVNVQDDYDPWDEVFQGRGFGRFLMVIGGLIALVGFGMWMYVIFSGFGADAQDMTNPFELELIPGVPLAVAGFAAFALGGILAGIGSGMSKAARKKAERLRRERVQQPRARERRHER